MLIPAQIMQYRCEFVKVIGRIYDDVGCPISDITSEPYVDELRFSDIPAYVTEIGSQEQGDGKQLNKATHLLYVNPDPRFSVIDKTFKVIISNITYSIVNVEECFDGHLEVTLTITENY